MCTFCNRNEKDKMPPRHKIRGIDRQPERGRAKSVIGGAHIEGWARSVIGGAHIECWARSVIGGART